MARKSTRPKLTLSSENREYLEKISRSGTQEARYQLRAKILLLYADGTDFSSIAKKLGVIRTTVYQWVDRALAIGPVEGIKDLPHQPFESKFTPEAKVWVLELACQKPKDLGFAAELWTRSSLAEYVRLLADEKGHPCLNQACKATIQRILNDSEIRPHKIKYYLEKRDPEFEAKREQVLIAYMEVNAANAKNFDPSKTPGTVTVCVDEKPGVQAIGLVAPDLPPVPGRHAEIGRDYEYKRFGTVSILAALDLNQGFVHARVEDRHRSAEFIALLRDLDNFYPSDCVIRVILDNHSAHTSQETMAWLATRPGRFEYVHTPVHGSWLNLAETLFSKMARTFLKSIRVANLQELKDRILQGVREMNQQPVIFRWKAFDLK